MRHIPQQIPKFITEYDLNKTAFYERNGLSSEVIPDYSGRVGFRIPTNNLYFELTERWNNNEHGQGWRNGNSKY
jgi:hypothetical protein